MDAGLARVHPFLSCRDAGRDKQSVAGRSGFTETALWAAGR